MADTTEVLEHFFTGSCVSGGLLLLGWHCTLIFKNYRMDGLNLSHGVLGFWGFGVLGRGG